MSCSSFKGEIPKFSVEAHSEMFIISIGFVQYCVGQDQISNTVASS